MHSQETTKKLPYHQIPEYPEEYTSGNVNARYIDGLGYRYYWATKDLTNENLSYRPSQEGRTIQETLEHLYGLSVMILNGTTSSENTSPLKKDYSYKELRSRTLLNFKKASNQLADKSAQEIAALKIVFGTGDTVQEVPFWHMFNGPIADAIYHTGQIVTLRRSAGNPMNPNVNVFMGITGE